MTKGSSAFSHECESWTIKKAERWRIDAFELWCWRRLLRVPWTARRSNESILNEISLEYHWKDWCWSWNSNTLELTHIRKRPWCWERLKAGGEGDDRGWDDWMASLTQWTGVWASSGSWWWTGKPGVLHAVRGVAESDTTEIPNWLNWLMATGLSTRNTPRCRHMWRQAQQISLWCPPRRSWLYCHCPGVLAIIGRQNSVVAGAQICVRETKFRSWPWSLTNSGQIN